MAITAGIAAAAPPLGAQTLTRSSTWWLDAGAAVVQQPGSTTRQAATIGTGGMTGGRTGLAGDRRGAWSIAGDGVFTVAQDSVGAAQGVVRASLTPSRISWTTSEIELTATALGVTLPVRNGSHSVAFQQAIHRGSLHLLGGGGVGYTSRFALNTRGTIVKGGMTGTLGALAGTFTLQHATTDDWQLMEASGFGLTRPAPSYVLRDARVDVSWQTTALQLTASGTTRAGVGATHGRTQAFAGAAMLQLSTSLYVIAQGGRQLADPLRGVPQANYLGVMARWQHRREQMLPASLSITRVVRNAESTLEQQASGATLTVRITAPANAVVDIASSATEWAPTRMTRTAEQFVARLTLPSGTHRVAVRIDNGSWRAPRGLVRVDDEFGGAAGIVVVP